MVANEAYIHHSSNRVDVRIIDNRMGFTEKINTVKLVFKRFQHTKYETIRFRKLTA